MIRQNTNKSRPRKNSGDLILLLLVVVITALFVMSSQIWS